MGDTGSQGNGISDPFSIFFPRQSVDILRQNSMLVTPPLARHERMGTEVHCYDVDCAIKLEKNAATITCTNLSGIAI